MSSSAQATRPSLGSAVAHAVGTLGAMAGVREKVAAGRIDMDFVELACRLASRAVAGRPSDLGNYVWSDDELEELVMEMVATSKPEKITAAALNARDDAAFARWLTNALVLQLNQTARGTWSGRLIRAVDSALEEAPKDFERVDGGWKLSGDARPMQQLPDLPQLRSVAWAVTPDENHMTDAALLGARPGVRSVAAAVLNTAGPLTKATLTGVVSDRFNTVFSVELDYLDVGNERHHVVSTSADPASAEAALRVVEQLTAEERAALGILAAKGKRALTKATGLTQHRAGLVAERVVDKVSRLVEEQDVDPQTTAELLVYLFGQLDSSGHSTDDGNHRDR